MIKIMFKKDYEKLVNEIADLKMHFQKIEAPVWQLKKYSFVFNLVRSILAGKYGPNEKAEFESELEEYVQLRIKEHDSQKVSKEVI